MALEGDAPLHFSLPPSMGWDRRTRGLLEVACLRELRAHRERHLVGDACDGGVAGLSGLASGRVLCGTSGEKIGQKSLPAGWFCDDFRMGNPFVSVGDEVRWHQASEESPELRGWARKSMGRTLHYKLRTGAEKLLEATVMRIVAAQALWNQRFTWSCERLSLGRERIYPLWPGGAGSALPEDVTTEEGWAIVNDLLHAGCRPAALEKAGYVLRDRRAPGVGMSGFTKVGSDEWNAYLVVRFLEGVSRVVPEAAVHVTDEGDFILAGSVICRASRWSLDAEKIRAQREYLVGHGFDENVEELDQAVLAAKANRFFADPLLEPYLDRKEFASIDLPKEELAGMSLEEAIPHLRFPEQHERKAAA